MTFGIGKLREEVTKQGEQISKNLHEIKECIPYQSNLERQYNKLIDTNRTLKEQLRELENCLTETHELNDKLLKYIESIEEVKQSGGVKAQSCCTETYGLEKGINYERIYIPGITLCKINEEDKYE